MQVRVHDVERTINIWCASKWSDFSAKLISILQWNFSLIFIEPLLSSTNIACYMKRKNKLMKHNEENIGLGWKSLQQTTLFVSHFSFSCCIKSSFIRSLLLICSWHFDFFFIFFRRLLLFFWKLTAYFTTKNVVSFSYEYIWEWWWWLEVNWSIG